MKVPILVLVDLNADIVLDLATRSGTHKKADALKAVEEALDAGPIGEVVQVKAAPGDTIRRIIADGGAESLANFSVGARWS